MKRDLRPVFDALESRKLLTASHVAAAEPVVPVALNGTLAVNVNDSSQSQNMDSSWTTTVPVSGQLGALGKVKGVWQTSVDQFGNYDGPDELILQTKTPKGTLDIAFNNVNHGKATKLAPGVSFYQHGQHLSGGSGAFALASESGSIELMVSGKKGAVASIVLITVPPTTPTPG